VAVGLGSAATTMRYRTETIAAGGRKGAKFEEAFWREGSAGDFEIIWRERSIARRF
jgi:hypothetical protein